MWLKFYIIINKTNYPLVTYNALKLQSDWSLDKSNLILAKHNNINVMINTTGALTKDVHLIGHSLAAQICGILSA